MSKNLSRMIYQNQKKMLGTRVEFKQYGGLTAYAPDDSSKSVKLHSNAYGGFSITPTDANGPVVLLLDADWVQYKKTNGTIDNLQGLPNDIAQLQSDLAAEITRASHAEESLDEEIVHQVGDLNALITGTTNAINDEIARATTAEMGLQSSIDALTLSSDGSVATVVASLQQEVARAQTAESALDVRITEEAQARWQSDSNAQAQFSMFKQETEEAIVADRARLHLIEQWILSNQN